MKSSPSKPSLDRVVHLAADGELSEGHYAKILSWLSSNPTPGEWNRTLRLWSLILGFALLVAGVIYFGAYNWNALSRFQKLGLLELVLSGLFLGTLSRGLDSTEGKVLLVCASTVVGGLLAVFGQAYQTGADAYSLFLGWSALILCWCCVGRSNVLWILEFVLINTSLTLYWKQAMEFDTPYALSLPFLVLNLTFAALWRWQKGKSDWMGSYVTELLLATALTPVTLTSFAAILFDHSEIPYSLIPQLLSLVILNKIRSRSLATRAILSASLLGLGTATLCHFFMDFDLIGILLVGLGVLAELAVLAKWLNSLHQSLKAESPAPAATPSEASTTEFRDAREVADRFDMPLDRAVALYEADSEMPWYVQLVIGFGAWLASLFVILFSLIWVTESDFLLVAFGLILYVASLATRARTRSIFTVQASLVSHISGLAILVFGIDDSFGLSDATTAFIAALLCLVSTLQYRDQLGRLLASGSFLGCALTTAVELAQDLGASVWLLACALAFTWVSLHYESYLKSSWKETFLPAYRGFAVAFLLGALHPIVGHWDFTLKALFAVGLTLATLWTCWKLGQPPAALLGLSVFAILTSSVPSLMAAILVFILGFHTHQRSVQAFSILALVGTGSYFYYSLDLTLFAKSMTLLLSGAVLLGLRLVLRPSDTRQGDFQSHAL